MYYSIKGQYDFCYANGIKEMKRVKQILLLLLFPLTLFGQSVYLSTNPAHKTNHYIYSFTVFADSSCYLKGYYPDNSIYFLYKGTLRKENDTLYYFQFQPVVFFGCNKRNGNGDTLGFTFNQKDTVLPNTSFPILKPDGSKSSLDLHPGYSQRTITGASTANFIFNTRFADPHTGDSILMTVGTLSEPDLTYFGSQSEPGNLRLILKGSELVVFPDRKYIFDRDTFRFVCSDVLKLKDEQYYRETNIIKKGKNYHLYQSVCHNQPGVVDEEFCYFLSLDFADPDSAKSKRVLNVEADTAIVKVASGISSAWNLGEDKNKITGQIEIVKWDKNEIILNENILVTNYLTRVSMCFVGTRTFKRDK